MGIQQRAFILGQGRCCGDAGPRHCHIVAAQTPRRPGDMVLVRLVAGLDPLGGRQVSTNPWWDRGGLSAKVRDSNHDPGSWKEGDGRVCMLTVEVEILPLEAGAT